MCQEKKGKEKQSTGDKKIIFTVLFALFSSCWLLLGVFSWFVACEQAVHAYISVCVLGLFVLWLGIHYYSHHPEKTCYGLLFFPIALYVIGYSTVYFPTPKLISQILFTAGIAGIWSSPSLLLPKNIWWLAVPSSVLMCSFVVVAYLGFSVICIFAPLLLSLPLLWYCHKTFFVISKILQGNTVSISIYMLFSFLSFWFSKQERKYIGRISSYSWIFLLLSK